MANLENWLPFANILPTNTFLTLVSTILSNISPPILGDEPICQCFLLLHNYTRHIIYMSNCDYHGIQYNVSQFLEHVFYTLQSIP